MELLHEMKEDIINLTRNGEAVRPRTLGQKMYVDAIRRNSITFGVGPREQEKHTWRSHWELSF